MRQVSCLLSVTYFSLAARLGLPDDRVTHLSEHRLVSPGTTASAATFQGLTELFPTTPMQIPQTSISHQRRREGDSKYLHQMTKAICSCPPSSLKLTLRDSTSLDGQGRAAHGAHAPFYDLGNKQKEQKLDANERHRQETTWQVLLKRLYIFDRLSNH